MRRCHERPNPPHSFSVSLFFRKGLVGVGDSSILAIRQFTFFNIYIQRWPADKTLSESEAQFPSGRFTGRWFLKTWCSYSVAFDQSEDRGRSELDLLVELCLEAGGSVPVSSDVIGRSVC